MKKTALILAFGLAATAPVLADGTNVFADEKSRESYALGMNLQQQGVEMDWDTFTRGFKDAQSGGSKLLTDQEMRDALVALQKNITAKQRQKQDAEAAKNMADSEAFLATNKTKPGVVTLPDGLQYKIVTEGNGEMPGDNDTIKMHYRFKLADGTEFDSSYKVGQPWQVVLRQIAVQGWREALKLMNPGSKWEVFIPPQLAFGDHSPTSRVPPGAVVILEVELLSVEHPQPQPQAVAMTPSSPNQPLTSDIIKVPSAEEMKQGAKIEIIKAEDVQKLQESKTNAAK